MACALLFDRTGEAPSSRDLGLVASGLQHRGPDGREAATKGPFAAEFFHFWTTPEDLDHHQPKVLADGRYWLFFDGRLDRRSELSAALGVSLARAAELADVELVGRAFLRWGTECWQRLVGPFAAIIVDHLEQTATMVRDPIGDRSLFYWLSPRLLAVASEESALLSHPEIESELHPRAVSRFLLGLELVDGTTLFRGITELLPAECITIGRDRTARSRFWRAADLPALRYRNEEEYVEHFREALAHSVNDRLRSTTPPVLQLSGGLDSTALAATVAAQRTEPLRAATWAFDHQPGCDERSWVDQTIAELGLDHRLIMADAFPAFHELSVWPHNPNAPDDSSFRPLVDQMYRTVEQWGSRVMMTGMWGDNLFLGAARWWHALLADGKWRAAYRMAGERIGSSGWWPFVRQDLLAPLIARWRWSPESWTATTRELACVQPRARSSWPLEGANPRRQRRILRAVSLINARATVTELFHLRRFRLDIRNPYRDRYLVELCLTMPEYMLKRGESTKYVLRRAMCGMMPRSVVDRRGKTSFGSHFADGVQNSYESLKRRLLDGERLWGETINKTRLLETLQSCSDPSEALILSRCILLSTWSSRLERSHRTDRLDIAV